MPAWRPLKRRELISALRKLGFRGPFSGGKHEFMLRDETVLTIQNPHRGDIGIALLSIILREAGVSRREWESA
jgi:predicted RNA binding protein YcfA (HicA-like mRNA interferase family)